MSRSLRALVLMLIVSSCGQPSAPPQDLENACNIVTERRHYMRAFNAAERKWGVQPHVLMAMIHQESKFIADARTPVQYTMGVLPMGRQSSAFGYSQALDGTWDEYREETGNRRAQRDDIRDATDFMGWYMNLTRERNGIALNDARNQYLAYHDGHTGFRKGTYWSKPWLVNVSNKVAQRSERYRVQLASCPAAR